MAVSPLRISRADGTATIVVGDAVATGLPDALRECSLKRKLIVVSDRTVASRLFVPLKNVLEGAGFDVVAAFVPEGEHRKHLKSSEALSTLLIEGAIGADAGIVAFGGGSVSDLAGFVAGTYRGGLPYVQIPTTLTAQIESLALRQPALNHPQQKNLITVEHPPCLVWNDVHYLESLPRRERLSGLGTLIARSAGLHQSLFTMIEGDTEKLLRFESGSLIEVVAKSAQLSVDHGGDDGRRAREIPLPGDTIADAIQLASRFRTIRYGEARLLGLLTEAYLALGVGVLPASEFQRIRRLAEALRIRFSLRGMKPWDLVRALRYESRAIIRQRQIPLLVEVGKATAGMAFDDGKLTDAFRWALAWAGDSGGALSPTS